MRAGGSREGRGQGSHVGEEEKVVVAGGLLEWRWKTGVGMVVLQTRIDVTGV